MQNIKLTISYDGSNYSGWQRQNRARSKTQSAKRTIQGTIESKLHVILKEKVSLIGSGRTDAGVHAIGQVANFKTTKAVSPDKIKVSLNGLLPEDIAVRTAEEVSLDFHSRFDAKSKIYSYLILNSNDKSVFVNSNCLRIKYPLDIDLMKEEAGCLFGKHDFKSFQASDKIERNSVTTIKNLEIKKISSFNGVTFLEGLKFICIDIEAEGFMYNMVRNIVGSLIEVGRGRFGKGSIRRILAKKNRRSAGPCVCANGLYLMKVFYD